MVGEPGFEPGIYARLKPAAYAVLPLPLESMVGVEPT